jgi:hypothetical protein
LRTLPISIVEGSALRDPAKSCPVYGVLIADPDGYDMASALIDLLINQAESLRSPFWDIELDPCESGEVAADAPLAE